MIFDDDDFFPVLQQPNDEPPADDEDSMHEAIQQYLRKRGSNFIGTDGPRREAASSSIARLHFPRNRARRG